MDQLVDTLNAQQREAVTHSEGPLLVLAGAGTGKTRVLVQRIVHLVQNEGITPSQVFSVTFTNKAANEMQERLEARLPDIHGLWLGTFHGLGLRMLRERHKEMDLAADFSVIDADDQHRLISDVITDAGHSVADHPSKQLAAVVNRWKDAGLKPDQVPFDDAQAERGLYVDLFRLYQERLKALHLVDFGDLLLKPLDLLRTNTRVKEQCHRRFSHILVDEAQDMNRVQYAWLRELAGPNASLCLVGDDDQSIYSWRGADVSQILNFQSDYLSACVVRLEQNYRSTPAILKLANTVIAQNQKRLDKALWTTSSDKEPVSLIRFFDERTEAKFIAKECSGIRDLSDVAILVRMAVQTQPLEEAFTLAGIPYRVVGAQRFYDRKEIRDALALLRLVTKSGDDLAFQRMVNVPSRGAGPATVSRLRRYATAAGTSMEDAVELACGDGTLKGKAKSGLLVFLAMLADCRQQTSLTLRQLLTFALDITGYQQLLDKDRTPAGESRREHIEQLLTVLESYEEPQAFFDHVALSSPADESSDAVTISTIHAAKGLEFDTMFVPGLDNGLLPHKHALTSADPMALEEERRLAYVAITRAKRRLFLSHAQHRRIYGQFMPFERSLFLQDY
ncbi:MAG: UvrD-helicase domain-containing protein [Filomicrobium sp.]